MPDKNYQLKDLLKLMATLRDPDVGCPWDLKQTFKTITSSTIEEAYELVDAIEQGDKDQIREELGDVLFQVVFYAQMAYEEEAFDFNGIVHGLTAKLVRRHPHVFPTGDIDKPERLILDEKEVKAQWEAIKQEERKGKQQEGAFDDIPVSLPAITRSRKILKRLPEDRRPQLTQSQEIAKKCLANLAVEADKTTELGKLLLHVVNIASLEGVDAEKALRLANEAFVKENQ